MYIKSPWYYKYIKFFRDIVGLFKSSEETEHSESKISGLMINLFDNSKERQKMLEDAMPKHFDVMGWEDIRPDIIQLIKSRLGDEKFEKLKKVTEKHKSFQRLDDQVYTWAPKKGGGRLELSRFLFQAARDIYYRQYSQTKDIIFLYECSIALEDELNISHYMLSHMYRHLGAKFSVKDARAEEEAYKTLPLLKYLKKNMNNRKAIRKTVGVEYDGRHTNPYKTIQDIKIHIKIVKDYQKHSKNYPEYYEGT